MREPVSDDLKGAPAKRLRMSENRYKKSATGENSQADFLCGSPYRQQVLCREFCLMLFVPGSGKGSSRFLCK